MGFFQHYHIEVPDEMSNDVLFDTFEGILKEVSDLGRIIDLDVNCYDAHESMPWWKVEAQPAMIHISAEWLPSLPDGLTKTQIKAIEEFENTVFWVMGSSDQGSGWMPGLCIGCGKYTYVYTDGIEYEDDSGPDYGEMGSCRYSKGYFRCQELHNIREKAALDASFAYCI